MIERLKREVTLRHGLLPRSDWDERIREALTTLSRRLGTAEERTAELVPRDPGLLRELAGCLTVDESYFFRQPADFTCLLGFVESAQADSGMREPMRFLSAGCSRGEEAYSIAIALVERFGAAARGRFEVLGCDLSREAIAVARRGGYRAWSFRDLQPEVLDRYFDQGRDEQRIVRRDLRDMVRFEHLDIREQLRLLPPGALDAIMFRNVALYLDRRGVEEIYAACAVGLRSGGLLVIAATDAPPAGELFARVCGASSPVYVRRDPAAATAAVAPALDSARSAGWRDSPPEVAPEAVDQALELADRGLIEEALALATLVVESDRGSGGGYLLRGRLDVAAGLYPEAVTDLRRALYADPGHALGRFWYAQALRFAGRSRDASRQLRVLQQRLGSIDPTALLEDRQTRCDELARAVATFMGSLE